MNEDGAPIRARGYLKRRRRVSRGLEGVGEGVHSSGAGYKVPVRTNRNVGGLRYGAGIDPSAFHGHEPPSAASHLGQPH